VVCFTDPGNKEDAAYEIIACSKEIAGFDFNQAYELEMNFNLSQQIPAAKYSKSILYLCAATKTSEGELVKYSTTFANEL